MHAVSMGYNHKNCYRQKAQILLIANAVLQLGPFLEHNTL